MTPFAQLEKSAHTAPAAGYKFQTNAAGLKNPYATQVAKAPTKGWGWGDTGLLAADVGIGSIPVVGGLWGLGRAGWDAAHGNWGGAAGNLGMAALGAVGLGGVGAAARAGVTAGRVGMAARAGANIAKLGQGTGVVAKGARGLMNAGEAASNLKAAGPTIFNGTKGVANPLAGTVGPATLGKIGPVTTGRAAHTAGATGAVMTPGMLLPDGSPAPLAPPPAALNPNASLQDQMTNAMINGPQ